MEIGVFALAFAVSALAGLAALLRSDQALTIKALASATLNSGVFGLGICLVWYTSYRDNVHFLIGVCVLAGLGGQATIDFALSLVRKKLETRLSDTEEVKK